MVGIGSAPNTYLMTRAAELGRGTFTHIGSVEQVEDRMRGLFAKLENPAVTESDRKILRRHRPTSRRPRSPTSIATNRWFWRRSSTSSPARSRSRAASATVPGSSTLPLANAAEGKGLSKLWARRKIADAEVARTTRQASSEDADKRILALALEHQLVTRLTSLVAVDKTPSRPQGEPLKAIGIADQPAGGLGFRQGIRRTPAAAGTTDGATCGCRRSAPSGRGIEARTAGGHAGA